MTLDTIRQAIRERRFLPSKPLRQIRQIDLQRDQEIIASRKYNGNFAAVSVEADEIQFYTASSLPLARLATTPFWHPGPWQEALGALPLGTVLLGEVFIPSIGIEDLSGIQKWFTWHRNGLAAEDGPPPPGATFRAFDILAYAGTPLGQQPYGFRWSQIPEQVRVESAPYQRLSQAVQAQTDSQRQGIEGFVFWDSCGPSLCKLGGSTASRGGAWKVKPIFTETFVLGALINPQPDTLVMRLNIGMIEFNCGSGLSADERRELVAYFDQGKTIQVVVSHNGYDDQGRPEMPRALRFTVA